MMQQIGNWQTLTMTRPDLLRAAAREAGQLLGLSLTVTTSATNDDDFVIRSRELPYPRSFGVLAKADYLAWNLELQADAESRPLLAKMQASLAGLSAEYVESFLEQVQNSNLKLSINGKKFSELGPDEDWLDFVCSGSVDAGQEPLRVGQQLSGVLQDIWSSALWFLDQILQEETTQEFGREEGRASIVSCTKYERNRTNRAKCLRHFGLVCQGCGELAEDKYGDLGRDVIHVHHLLPVSLMGESRIIDPIKDLVPLCPTCHNVVHRENPPVSIERLREVTGFNG